MHSGRFALAAGGDQMYPELLRVEVDSIRTVDDRNSVVRTTVSDLPDFKLGELENTRTHERTLYQGNEVTQLKQIFKVPETDQFITLVITVFEKNGQYQLAGLPYMVKQGAVKFNIRLDNWKFSSREGESTVVTLKIKETPEAQSAFANLRQDIVAYVCTPDTAIIDGTAQRTVTSTTAPGEKTIEVRFQASPGQSATGEYHANIEIEKMDYSDITRSGQSVPAFDKSSNIWVWMGTVVTVALLIIILIILCVSKV